MGYKKLSDEQEKQLVQEYISGIPVKDLMIKYNFATKKSITDKVKKHYGENYKNFQINEYNGLWKIGSANHNNILKLITLSYDKPFGMERKYKEIRKTFNDYNNSALFTD